MSRQHAASGDKDECCGLSERENTQANRLSLHSCVTSKPCQTENGRGPFTCRSQPRPKPPGHPGGCLLSSGISASQLKFAARPGRTGFSYVTSVPRFSYLAQLLPRLALYFSVPCTGFRFEGIDLRCLFAGLLSRSLSSRPALAP